MRKKEHVIVSMDIELHRKLAQISFAYQYGTGKKVYMSDIVNKAVYEYLEQNKQEINEAVNACAEKYQWFKL